MRLLYVSDNYKPARGGLELTLSLLAEAQAANGNEVRVATLSRADAPAVEVIAGVQIHRLDGWIKHLRRFAADPGHQFHPTFRDPRLVRSLQAIVDEFRPDLVHVAGWIYYSVMQVRLPPRTALIASLHDFSLICANKTLFRPGNPVCEGPETLKCLRCATSTYGAAKGIPLAAGMRVGAPLRRRPHLFLTNSDYVADVTARATGLPRDHFVVVSPPIPDVPAGKDEVRPSFLPDGDFILFVGAMGAHKGLDVLLDAHAQLSNRVPLVVLGMPRRDSPSCDRPGVRVRHGVPHDEVMACWRAATVGALPSVCAEAFGRVAVEALGVGVPMVVSKVGGLQEVVEDGVTGFVVPPGDVGSLAEALDCLLGDGVLRARMGEAGKVRAERYRPSAVAPHLDACYERARKLAAAT